MPLADELRPKTIDEVVGQKHLLAPGRILRTIIDNKTPANLIFYGPPGTGKTTVANIIAEQSGMDFHKINAVNASISDIKAVIKNHDPGDPPVMIYLDEMQYFNKKQQQSLLEVMENGTVQLITSTTENPYFCIYGAILSRSSVFEFKPLTAEDVLPAVQRALSVTKSRKDFTYEDSLPMAVAISSGGDARKAITTIELLTDAVQPGAQIMTDDIYQLSHDNTLRYDRYGDQTYDLASGLHKSLRGSDPDAALHYLARFLVAGDLITPCRRILCVASEDVGLANPMAPVIAKACVDTATQLGLPEAALPLAHAVLFLATSPKSNSVHEGINQAMQDIRDGYVGDVPRNLQNKHADSTGQETGQNYLYPHDYPLHWIPQNYMPANLQNKRYYIPGDNQNETALQQYWNAVKSAYTKHK